jgi:hypothetical protein
MSNKASLEASTMLGLRLRDQQAGEWVLVCDVYVAARRVANRDCQVTETLSGDDRLEVIREQRGTRELAGGKLGADPHGLGGADRDIVAFVSNGLMRSMAQGFISRQAPDQRMGVQQRPQARSQPCSSSSGKGSVKRASTAILPLSASNWGLPLGTTGTSRTTGALPRAVQVVHR